MKESIYVKRRQARIDEYNKAPKSCMQCNSILPWSRNVKRSKFCSMSCAASFRNKGVRRHGNALPLCLKCKQPVKRGASIYCSSKCCNTHKCDERILNWKDGIFAKSEQMPKYIKPYLMKKFNNACEECGWSEIHPVTGLYPLQVEHIDGNCTNHSEDNLKLLCPNCHSLTPTFGFLNNGNGKRRKKIPVDK